jgi:hypothetical protein
VSDTERIYSLYVQANPVPEPQLLPESLDKPELLILERSPAMITEVRPEAQADSRKPARWRVAVIAFAAVIVLVGGAIWVAALIGGDTDLAPATDTSPTLTFDGTTASYAGPTTFTENSITFTLENPTNEMVAFGWNVMNDESITLEEEIAWMEAHRGPTYEIPPWVEDYGGITPTSFMADVVEATVELPDGKILLYVWQQSDRILYPAAHITVETN